MTLPLRQHFDGLTPEVQAWLDGRELVTIEHHRRVVASLEQTITWLEEQNARFREELGLPSA